MLKGGERKDSQRKKSGTEAIGAFLGPSSAPGSPTPQLDSAHPEVVEFGSWQSRNRRTPTGVGGLRRGPAGGENAAGGRKMPFMGGH